MVLLSVMDLLTDLDNDCQELGYLKSIMMGVEGGRDVLMVFRILAS